MNIPFGNYVVDATVGVKLFIADPLSNNIHALFQQLAHQPPIRLAVPDLFYIEVTNVLWKYVRWQGLPIKTAQAYLNNLNQLTLDSFSTATLMEDALNLAANNGLTAYDASYVALALKLQIPLITTDTKLAKAMNKPQLIYLLKVE